MVPAGVHIRPVFHQCLDHLQLSIASSLRFKSSEVCSSVRWEETSGLWLRLNTSTPYASKEQGNATLGNFLRYGRCDRAPTLLGACQLKDDTL